jgi:hypothetical protein
VIGGVGRAREKTARLVTGIKLMYVEKKQQDLVKDIKFCLCVFRKNLKYVRKDLEF